MATTSTELAKTSVVTADGVVNATLVDRVSPERLVLMLVRGSASARYAGTEDQTSRLSPELRSLVVNPKAEDG